MKSPRGPGSIYSTPKARLKAARKRWFPFHMNPATGRKRAKANQIKRKGLALPDDKASMRAIGEQAKATFKRP